MEFLSARAPIAVTWGVLDVAVPMVVIMLSAFLFVIWHVRQMLNEASAKTSVDVSISESVTGAATAAQRKRRTHKQRKQARKVGAAKLPELKPDSEGSKVGKDAVADAELSAIGKALSEQFDAEANTDHPQSLSESEDDEIDAEVGATFIDSIAEKTTIAEAVRAHDRAPAAGESGDLEVMTQRTSDINVVEEDCSCAGWGCDRHFVYSSALLLAHRELSIKIAKGPPGLELPEAAKAQSATRTCFAMRF